MYSCNMKDCQKKGHRKRRIIEAWWGGHKGWWWCGFAWFLVWFCRNCYFNLQYCGLFYKTKRFVVFRNFGVISMRFAVFYVILCSVYTYICAVLRCSYAPYSPLFDHCRIHILIFHTVNVWHQNNKWLNKLLCLFTGERLHSITVFILYSLDKIYISLLWNTRAG